MAKGLGNNDLVWVESTTPGTYNLVKGQGNLKVARTRAKIDLSDKTSAGFKLGAFGLSDLSITLDVEPDLPDTTGWTRMETLANALPAAPFNIQIRKGGTAGSGTDVVFAASVYAQITGDDYSQDQVVKKSVDFSLAAPPTTDLLAV